MNDQELLLQKRCDEECVSSTARRAGFGTFEDEVKWNHPVFALACLLGEGGVEVENIDWENLAKFKLPRNYGWKSSPRLSVLEIAQAIAATLDARITITKGKWGLERNK